MIEKYGFSEKTTKYVITAEIYLNKSNLSK